MKRALGIFLFALMFAELGHAVNVPAQGRVFIGATSVDPTDYNQELQAQGLKSLKTLPKYGAEITFPIIRFLEVGLNYTKQMATQDELNSNTVTPYQAEIDQDAVMAVARVPFLKTSILRLDAFAGIGGSNTTIKIKSSTLDGELTRRESNDWFASLYSSYGASLAIGYKKVYLVFEGGYQSNTVDKFKSTGIMNDNIQKLNLSGGYATIGLLFDGVSTSKK